ncbi:MAG: hypothetical protein HY554_14620 [Elusimicrobia bacterium]|nr:hypothetical protein [Elusimicrobiota bacterium]
MKIAYRLLCVAALALAACSARRPLGGRCDDNGDCASKLVCNYGTCAKGNCGGSGSKCQTDDDCCGTFRCTDRKCY